ncbi:MAG: RluA family pseudouridine synthase, partial [Alphaproteobacteria bacterium]
LGARFPQVAFTHIQRIVRTGQLRVDGARVKPNDRLAEGQSIRVPPLKLAEHAPRSARGADDLEFLKSITLYEDADVLVLNKPAGLAVQGGPKMPRHLDRLLPALDRGGERCRLVHRLDRDTAGLLLLGRGAGAAAHLSEQFRRGRVTKLYWALVRGRVREPHGMIDLALAKAGGPGRERVVGDDDGKPAKTLFRVVARAGKVATWLALRPVTGRTHQLRAHCAAIGHPILGDPRYPDARGALTGQPAGLMLLARAASLTHPSGRPMRLEAPLSPALEAGFDWLGFAVEAGREHALEDFAR